MSRPSHWPPAVYDHPLPQLLHDIGAGLASLPASDGRRHHFVPQLVLRGFTSPTKAKHVVHLDKATGQTRTVPIKSAGYEARLYGVKDDDGDYDNRIEALLSVIEGYAAPALRRLLEGQSTASEDDILPISLAMGLQLTRTPGVLDRVGDLMEQLGQAELERLIRDPTAYARHLAATRGDDSLSPADAELRRLQAVEALDGGVRVRLSSRRAAGLDIMVTGLVEAGFAMAQADWWILHAEPPCEFVVNDYGFARLTSAERLSGPVARGIAFPVRSDRCIVVAPATSDECQVFRALAGASDVRTINLRTYGWADKFIFGSTQHAVQSVRATARKSPLRARPPTDAERLPGPP